MKKIIIFISILLITIVPLNAQAKTISEFEAEVDRFTKDLQDKQRKLVTNAEEVAKIKRKIAVIETQIYEGKKEAEALEEEIKKSNEEIKKKVEESKAILEYYQISNGDNAYLEYAFGAKSITDMIYRMSVIEQLTEYNDKVMKELEELIARNEARKKELKKKEENLNRMSANLEEEKRRINMDSASIRETMPSIEQQIKSAKANIEYYKSLKCGRDEDIARCQYRIEQANGGSTGSVPSTNGFLRPMEYGYVTQRYGGYGGHLGVDLSSSDKGIAIYPIATGRVWKIMYDPAGALVVKIKHNYNGRYIYSTYAHFSRFGNISEGQVVTPYSVIGYMGSTGNSTGPHLHMELTSCDWNRGGGCTWGSYQRSTLNPFNYVELPSRWNNR